MHSTVKTLRGVSAHSRKLQSQFNSKKAYVLLRCAFNKNIKCLMLMYRIYSGAVVGILYFIRQIFFAHIARAHKAVAYYRQTWEKYFSKSI